MVSTVPTYHRPSCNTPNSTLRLLAAASAHSPQRVLTRALRPAAGVTQCKLSLRESFVLHHYNGCMILVAGFSPSTGGVEASAKYKKSLPTPRHANLFCHASNCDAGEILEVCPASFARTEGSRSTANTTERTLADSIGAAGCDVHQESCKARLRYPIV